MPIMSWQEGMLTSEIHSVTGCSTCTEIQQSDHHSAFSCGGCRAGSGTYSTPFAHCILSSLCQQSHSRIENMKEMIFLTDNLTSAKPKYCSRCSICFDKEYIQAKSNKARPEDED